MLPAYREYRPPPGLEPVVACLWENEPAEDRPQRVVPDGCVDLIWVAERELVIAGADTVRWCAARRGGSPLRALASRASPPTSG